MAAIARWEAEGKEVPVLAAFGAADRPLRIGPIEIPAYVLADGRRVLVQRGLQLGIGLSEGGGRGGARRLTAFMQSLERKGVDTKGLIARVDSPIRFIPTWGGTPAHGYDAGILPDICAVIIEANRLGKLHPQQQKLAEQCAILQHGFAVVGIYALVDEATGYQDVRARDALAKILEKFVAKELRPWMQTFPGEFYRHMFRLRGWALAEDARAKPPLVGKLTNNLVYERLAPGVLQALRERNPTNEKGKRKNKHHQWLTNDTGHPKLREHLASVTDLMKISDSWDQFMLFLDRARPKYQEMPLFDYADQNG